MLCDITAVLGRDYSTEGQLGLERTPEEYVRKMVEIFRELRPGAAQPIAERLRNIALV